jgi:hypothetical protein
MIHLWFMHDDSLPHLFLATREVVNNLFPTRFTGRGGPTVWSAISPDLNPFDFYLRRYLKSAVYAAEVSDVQYWQQRTQNGFVRPGVFQRVIHSAGALRLALKLKSGH